MPPKQGKKRPRDSCDWDGKRARKKARKDKSEKKAIVPAFREYWHGVGLPSSKYPRVSHTIQELKAGFGGYATRSYMQRKGVLFGPCRTLQENGSVRIDYYNEQGNVELRVIESNYCKRSLRIVPFDGFWEFPGGGKALHGITVSQDGYGFFWFGEELSIGEFRVKYDAIQADVAGVLPPRGLSKLVMSYVFVSTFKG
jgi:hypothetical protein